MGEQQAFAQAPEKVEVDYLTAGKRYLIVASDGRGMFRVKTDSGSEIVCLWVGCAHLDGGDWIPAKEGRQ